MGSSHWCCRSEDFECADVVDFGHDVDADAVVDDDDDERRLGNGRIRLLLLRLRRRCRTAGNTVRYIIMESTTVNSSDISQAATPKITWPSALATRIRKRDRPKEKKTKESTSILDWWLGRNAPGPFMTVGYGLFDLFTLTPISLTVARHKLLANEWNIRVFVIFVIYIERGLHDKFE